MTALWTIVVFTLAHVVEGYVITPLVTQRQVRLLPAFTLAAQALFASLFGVLGLAFATPIMVAATIVVRSLYVEDILNDRERTADRPASPSPAARDQGAPPALDVSAARSMR
jgi:predicted PurR-regulated permease PerM